MPVKLEPTSVIKASLGIEENGKVQSYFTERCYAYMDKYVPMNTGNLRRNVTLTSDTITYESPYAHYQYLGLMYADPVTGKGAFYNPDYGFWSRKGVKKVATERPLDQHNGGPYWDKKMWSIHKTDIENEIQNKFFGGK